MISFKKKNNVKNYNNGKKNQSITKVVRSTSLDQPANAIITLILQMQGTILAMRWYSQQLTELCHNLRRRKIVSRAEIADQKLLLEA